MKTRIGLAAIALLLLAGLLVLFLRMGREQPPLSQSTPKPAPQSVSRPVGALPVPDDWTSVAEEEMEQWIAELSQNSFDIALSEGESFLTDGYEVSPGVFRFTEISVKQEGDIIRIGSLVTQVDIAGEVDLISAPTIFTESGRKAQIAMLGGDSGGESVFYTLELIATESGNGSIQLSGKERHR